MQPARLRFSDEHLRFEQHEVDVAVVHASPNAAHVGRGGGGEPHATGLGDATTTVAATRETRA